MGSPTTLALTTLNPYETPLPTLLTSRRRPIEAAHATFASEVAVERKREVTFVRWILHDGARFCALRLLRLTNITISACRASCSFVIRSGAVKHDETPLQ